MKITNTSVHDLEDAIVASGFAMLSQFDELEYRTKVDVLKSGEFDPDDNKDFQRAIRLAATDNASGHASFLKLITVNANFTAPIKWWEEAQRYTNFHIGSSMSTMHKGGDFNYVDMLDPKVDIRVRHAIESVQNDYKAGVISKEEMVKSIPVGMMLTARCTTNYLQLRIMYAQRFNHQLPDWRDDFCAWVRSLPYAKELILGGKYDTGKKADNP